MKHPTDNQKRAREWNQMLLQVAGMKTSLRNIQDILTQEGRPMGEVDLALHAVEDLEAALRKNEDKVVEECSAPGVWTGVESGETASGRPAVSLIFHPDGAERPTRVRVCIDPTEGRVLKHGIALLSSFLRAVGYEGPSDAGWAIAFRAEGVAPVLRKRLVGKRSILYATYERFGIVYRAEPEGGGS